MKEFVEGMISSIITTYGIYYGLYNLLKEKMELKNKKFLLIWIIHSLIMTIIFYLYPGNFLRIVIMYGFLIVFGKLLLKKNIIKILLSSFLTYVLLFISEIFGGLILTTVFRFQLNYIRENFFMNIYVNMMIILILMFFLNIKKIRNLFISIVNEMSLKLEKTFILISILTILSLSVLAYYIYYETSPINTLLLNLILIMIYSSLTVMLFKESNDKIKLASKYDIMVNNSKKYEEVIQEFRMNNHENQNNLIVLRGLIKKTNKKAVEYINDLINEELKEDNSLHWQTRNIPTGGLQGIIYQKLLEIKEKKIDYHLEVNKNINKEKIEKLNVKTNKDLCTIVGIFLDNAIQEVEKIKEKNIGIYLYQEKNEFYISISNTYRGKMNLEKLSEKGYTTKGEGHGYGLSLVDEIISKHSNFKNERTIKGNAFVQKLSIRLRNTKLNFQKNDVVNKKRKKEKVL